MTPLFQYTLPAPLGSTLGFGSKQDGPEVGGCDIFTAVSQIYNDGERRTSDAKVSRVHPAPLTADRKQKLVHLVVHGNERSAFD